MVSLVNTSLVRSAMYVSRPFKRFEQCGSRLWGGVQTVPRHHPDSDVREASRVLTGGDHLLGTLDETASKGTDLDIGYVRIVLFDDQREQPCSVDSPLNAFAASFTGPAARSCAPPLVKS